MGEAKLIDCEAQKESLGADPCSASCAGGGFVAAEGVCSRPKMDRLPARDRFLVSGQEYMVSKLSY